MLTALVVAGSNTNDAVAENERLLKGVNELASYLETRLVKKVVEKGKVASGKGVESIEVKARAIIDAMIITESHEGHMTFVDLGRKKGSRRVPIAALEQWLKIKQFGWAAGNIRGAAFAVQTNIFKFGIKPSRWISETLSDEITRIEADISVAVIKQVDILINNVINKAIKTLTI